MTKIKNLKLARDSESLNIYVDNGDDKDPTHICYWYFEEWEEDAELVVPAMLVAMELFYTDQFQLVNTLGMLPFIKVNRVYCTVCESAYIDTTQDNAIHNCTMCVENIQKDDPTRILPKDNVENDYIIDAGNE